MPYDANRVQLPSGEYINGSYITAFGRHFIVAETPQMHEDEKFWELISSHEIDLIVTLGEEAATLFPEKRSSHFTGTYNIKCLHEKIHKISETEFVTRRYHLIGDGNSRRTLVELAYTSTDDALPTPAALSYLNKKMRKTNAPLIHTQKNMRLAGALIAATTSPKTLTAQRPGLL